MTPSSKKGILLVNLGTPDAPSRGAVYRYLKQFLLDRRVIDVSWLQRQLLVRGIIAPFRSGKSSKEYKKLWTPEGSPLKIYGEGVVKGVQERLGDDYLVALAMRYQKPSIEKVVNQLLAEKVSEIIVFPMFPHYASASTGSAHEEVMRVLSKQWVIPKVSFINSYYDAPELIQIFADNARKFDLSSYDHVLFSYHGLPERQLLKADDCNHCLQSEDCCKTITKVNQFCYSAQANATTQAIAKNLSLKEGQYTSCYQSRLGRTKWLEPFTIDVIEKLASEGKKRLLVFSPAFVADCLETTVEIAQEYQEDFRKLGGEKIDLVPSLNEDPRWMDFITEMVR